MLLHTGDHMGEIVFWVCILAVRINSRKGHPPVPELLSRLARHLVRSGYVRAMIASEEDNQEFRVREVAQGVAISIRGWQIEIRSG